LESNLEEATKLEELINNLLRLTRLEADELQQNFETVDLQKVAEKAIEDTRKLSQSRKVRINKSLKSIKIQGDENSLIQLVVILLDNAIKYSSSGGEVNVKLSLINNNAVIVISDEGIGIDPIALEKVFERFYRADNSRTKTDIDGTGLGLSIADMIVDIHKGNIELSSQVGKGTTATVSLPQNIA
jgi:signal transduction histidine kinase